MHLIRAYRRGWQLAAPGGRRGHRGGGFFFAKSQLTKFKCLENERKLLADQPSQFSLLLPLPAHVVVSPMISSLLPA